MPSITWKRKLSKRWPLMSGLFILLSVLHSSPSPIRVSSLSFSYPTNCLDKINRQFLFSSPIVTKKKKKQSLNNFNQDEGLTATIDLHDVPNYTICMCYLRNTYLMPHLVEMYVSSDLWHVFRDTDKCATLCLLIQHLRLERLTCVLKINKERNIAFYIIKQNMDHTYVVPI